MEKIKCKICLKEIENKGNGVYCGRACYFTDRKTWRWSDETKKKMSDSRLGYKMDSDTKKKISETRKQKKFTAWNKGLNKDTDERVKNYSKKATESIREGFKKGRIPHNWNGGPINWKGYNAGRKSKPYGEGWKIVSRKFKKNNPLCARCGNLTFDAHHKDGNGLNNNLENLEALCRSCHQAVHRKIRSEENQ